MKKSIRPALALLLLASAMLACNFGKGTSTQREATAQALSDSILKTATAAASQNENSSKLLPTAQAEATARSQAALATQSAQSEQSDAQAQATSAAFAPIRAELPKYGIDPGEGKPGWIHPPVTLDIQGYKQYAYANQNIGTVVADFVISADITWNTDTGLSGCGFALRSDGEKQNLNQYLVIATRGASGHVLFGTMANGEVVTGQDIYAYGIDPNFDWQNDSTNRITVVGRGNKFTIYSNDTRLGEIDPSAPPPQPIFPSPPEEPPDKKDAKAVAKYLAAKAEYDSVVAQIKEDYQKRLADYKQAETKFDRGFVAMVALSESGHTVCKFDNAWLWLLN